MTEKLLLAALSLWRQTGPKLFGRLAALRLGPWLALAVAALVLGRALWVSASRPAHRREIADAFGSAGILYGKAQPDPTGARLTFVQQSDNALTLFLADTATGRKEPLHEEPEGDVDFSLRAWPWSPDGAFLAWSTRRKLTLYEVGPDRPAATFNLASGISALVWLSPDALVYLASRDDLYLLRKRPNSWERTPLKGTLVSAPGLASAAPAFAVKPRPGGRPGPLPRQTPPTPSTPPGTLNTLSGAFSLSAVSSNSVAWGQGNRIWALDVVSNTLSVLYDLPGADPIKGPALGQFACARGSGDPLLVCKEPKGECSLWQVALRRQDSPLRLAPPGTVASPVWLDHDSGACACLLPRPENNNLLVYPEPRAQPLRLFPLGNVEAFAPSEDGRHLFILGVLSNEPAPGIWHYELASDTLKPLVPWSDHPSPAATRLEPKHDSLDLPDGRKLDYYTYLPGGFSRRQRKQYPLVIGDTVYGAADALYQRRAHGPLWAPALAQCGAYVVIVNRPGWMGGIDQWPQHVMAVYDLLRQDPTIDPNRVFLYGASAETHYLGQVLTEHPHLWAGALLLNPGSLPDLSSLPLAGPAPRILISLGELEHGEDRIRRYQQEALSRGVAVEYVVHKGATHWLRGKTAVWERTRAMVHFIFDE